MGQSHRLERSRSDKVIAGVAGGMAEYFEIDPVLARVGWVVFGFATAGAAILLYIVMAIIMPKQGTTADSTGQVMAENAAELTEDAAEWTAKVRQRRERTRNWFAIGLIVAGALLLLGNLGVFSGIPWGIIWPVAIIAIGVTILFARIRG